MEAADLAYRSARLDVVVRQAQEDLGGAWKSLLSDPVERAAAGMREALPAVVEEYGALAADNAAIWYEDMRPASAAKYTPKAFAPKSLTDATGLTTWGVTPLFQDDPATAWERLAGTVQRLVADHDRTTVEENITRDPAGFGWRRRASADACAYCAYMAVVLDQPNYETASKKYHDNCRCVPVMAFQGETIPEQPNGAEWEAVFNDAYAAVSRDQWAARRRSPGMRERDFFKKHPNLSLTTKNILHRARRIEPGLFRDGVHAKAV